MRNARQILSSNERRRWVSLTICVIGLLLSAGQVMAGTPNPEPDFSALSDNDTDRVGLTGDDYLEEIIVTEGPATSRQKGRTGHGFPIKIIERKRRVSYTDLDLSREADVTELETRVETAAKRSCEELAPRRPLELTANWTVERCTNEAINRSLDEVQAAIAAKQ